MDHRGAMWVAQREGLNGKEEYREDLNGRDLKLRI